MPAVQLVQLNQQINSLTPHFADPVIFRNELEALLIRYADLTYKPGQAVQQSKLSISSYRTAPIVLRKLEQHLAGLSKHNPELALVAADHLWQADQAEMRRLAAIMVGNVPGEFSGQVLERMQTWAVPGEKPPYLGMLFELGSVELRRTDTLKWMNLIRSWLSDSNLEMARLGLLAVTTLVNDRDFENLPAVYNAISPLVAETPDELQFEMRSLIVKLARRAPTETGYFLRQVMGMYPSASLFRLVRRILPEFPEEIQDRLRSMLLASPRGKE